MIDVLGTVLSVADSIPLIVEDTIPLDDGEDRIEKLWAGLDEIIDDWLFKDEDEIDKTALELNDSCTVDDKVLSADGVTELNDVVDTDAVIECVCDGDGDAVGDAWFVIVAVILFVTSAVPVNVESTDDDVLTDKEITGVDVIVKTLLTEDVMVANAVIEIEPDDVLLLKAVELVNEERVWETDALIVTREVSVIVG